MFDVTHAIPIEMRDKAYDLAVAAAIGTAMELHGCDALTAAAMRALNERDVVGRSDHYRFWTAIFHSLKAASTAPANPPAAG